MAKKSVGSKRPKVDTEELRCILKDAKFCMCSTGCHHETAREQLEDWSVRYMRRFLAEFEEAKAEVEQQQALRFCERCKSAKWCPCKADQ